MNILSKNPMWDAFGMRALSYTFYGSADLGECFTTVQRVGETGTADAWYREWMKTADRVATIAEGSQKQGHRVSAREAYFRAASYYHAAYFPLFGKPVDPRLTKAFDIETATFLRAAALMEPAIEPVEIPFEGKTLPGYFLRPAVDGNARPTMLHVNGYDANIQEMYFAHGSAALRRGYNCLLVDGPGQGRNLIRDDMALRPDWEVVVRSMVDYGLSRPEIDPKKIVLCGWSFGGFLAPRAAAFERRIAALVADPGQWDQVEFLRTLGLPENALADITHADPALFAPLENMLRSPNVDPMTKWKLQQRGFWVHGVDRVQKLAAEMAKFKLSPVVEGIRCPTLLTYAEGDPVGARAPILYNALRCSKKELLHFTEAEGAGGHCEGSGRALYHQRVFDWLDQVLSYSM